MLLLPAAAGASGAPGSSSGNQPIAPTPARTSSRTSSTTSSITQHQYLNAGLAHAPRANLTSAAAADFPHLTPAPASKLLGRVQPSVL
jgi:hypothetical protein